MQRHVMHTRLGLFCALAVLLALPVPGRADYAPGTRVPTPTAANQSVYSGSTAPFVYQLVTLPYTTNGSQMAVGGTVDSTSRLSVNPSGTAENGITVNMVSAGTGKGLVIKETGTSSPSNYPLQVLRYDGVNLFFVDQYGNLLTNNATGFVNGTVRAGSMFGPTNRVISITQNGYNFFSQDQYISDVEIGIQAISGQTADFLDFNTSTGATSARVDKNYNAQFPGYSQAVRTVTGADTATLADSLILINGAYAETLPTTTNPTGRVYTVKNISASMASVTNTIDGTAGYTLMQNMYVQVCWDGSTFRKIGGN